MLYNKIPIGIAGKDVAFNQDIKALKLNDNVLVEYLFQWFSVKQHFLMNKVVGTGIGAGKLATDTLRKIEIFLPSLPEQQKITSFLTAVDQKLSQLTQKKALLEQYKKGAMQQLFFQELRFKQADCRDFRDWEEKRLGDLTHITTGSSNRVDSSLVGQYTFFDRSEDIRTSDIFLFDNETVIIPGEGQKFVPKYFIGKFDLHQRTYAIMDFNECLGKFIFYYISFHTNYLLSQAVGSTVKSLRLPMFKKMKMNLPSLPEQQKIATFLSAIDTKNEMVSQQIAKAQTFKKGLLEKMFV